MSFIHRKLLIKIILFDFDIDYQVFYFAFNKFLKSLFKIYIYTRFVFMAWV